MTTFYLDLDRTLFRTEKVDELFAAIAGFYPDTSQVSDAYEQRQQYYVVPFATDGDTRTYYHDTVAQLEAMGIDAAEAFASIQPLLGDGRFEYDGLPAFISLLRKRGEVKVLTFGEDRYQRAKAALCPSLANVEVITILVPKAQWLNTHASAGDWIVDDRILEGLLPGIHALHIQHDTSSVADIHSLTEAGDYICHNIDKKS